MSDDVMHIGIDPSYSAFALVQHFQQDGHTWTEEEVFDFSPKKAGTGGKRLRFIRESLHRHLAETRVRFELGAVVMEGYAPNSKFNREILGELGGVTKLALTEMFPQDRLYIASTSALKKFVTGSGTAPKDNMLLQVYKKWGVEFKSNDLADAYGLMQIALALTHGAKHKYEQEVVDALKKGGDNLEK